MSNRWHRGLVGSFVVAVLTAWAPAGEIDGVSTSVVFDSPMVTLAPSTNTAAVVATTELLRTKTTILALATGSSCDPNYSECVPISSDVDCAGGSGNGPAYVRGPVQVLGSDIYGLDRDNDGIGCE